jgi:hypothetical protein
MSALVAEGSGKRAREQQGIVTEMLSCGHALWLLHTCMRMPVDAAGMQQALKTQGQLKSWKKLLNGAIRAAA